MADREPMRSVMIIACKIAPLTLAVVCTLTVAAQSVEAASPLARIGDNAIRQIVSDIGQGIDQARLSSVPSNGAHTTLMIKFTQASSGDELNKAIAAKVEGTTIRVMAAMQQVYATQFRFISDASREALISDIKSGVSGKEERNRAIADLGAQTTQDILVRPFVYFDNGEPHLAYQAIATVTAEILVTSRSLPLTWPEVKSADSDKYLEQQHDADLPRDPRKSSYQNIVPKGSDRVFRPITLEAERLLLAHGYNPGWIDGYIDEDFRKALSLYQADSALPVNGRMTWETVENLRRDRRHVK